MNVGNILGGKRRGMVGGRGELRKDNGGNIYVTIVPVTICCCTGVLYFIDFKAGKNDDFSSYKLT